MQIFLLFLFFFAEDMKSISIFGPQENTSGGERLERQEERSLSRADP